MFFIIRFFTSWYLLIKTFYCIKFTLGELSIYIYFIPFDLILVENYCTWCERPKKIIVCKLSQIIDVKNHFDLIVRCLLFCLMLIWDGKKQMVFLVEKYSHCLWTTNMLMVRRYPCCRLKIHMYEFGTRFVSA